MSKQRFKKYRRARRAGRLFECLMKDILAGTITPEHASEILHDMTMKHDLETISEIKHDPTSNARWMERRLLGARCYIENGNIVFVIPPDVVAGFGGAEQRSVLYHNKKGAKYQALGCDDAQ